MILYFNYVTKTIEYLKKHFFVPEKSSQEAIKIGSWKLAVRFLGEDDYTKYSESQINVAMQKFKRNANEDSYYELTDLIVDYLIEHKNIKENHSEEVRTELVKFIE